MINMETFFKNHFNTNKISDENLRKFAEIHLQRLSANNGGGDFSQMITDVTNAYSGYFGSITDEDTKFAVQQGLTIAVENAVANFKKAVSQKEGLVRATFGKDSPQYQEFFPLGVTEYSQATLQNIEMLMNRFVNAAVAHQAQLGAALVTEFQGYLTAYTTARTSQLVKIGEVADSKTSTSVQRDAVEVELMKNVHLIGAMFVGDVNRCMDFFDQSFVRDSGGGDDEDPVPPTP
ncbi:MAG: hypothetical protein IPM14_11405 [bacterium]|nr:hypothetical protein [bacterium]